MTYHYTATFDNCELKYHGEITFKYVEIKDTKGNEERIVTACKKQLIKDCEDWNISVKDINSFECYYYDESEEVQIMKWEKKK